ncbi:SH3 domain-containing protein [Lacisediminimonas sp.]|uniref:SH3 domain-containing protein n=1 Tax=Lacisediminimonas sp. TaxID=3060582 RepID=UPI00351DA810
MKTGRTWLPGAMLLLLAGLAQAAEFRSVGAAPAVLVDAPSERARKLAIAPRGMPVEVVITYGEWIKVRDASGELSWLPAKSLEPRRNLVVTAAMARVQAAADEGSPLVFRAERNVLLERLEAPTSGWVRVRHADGQSGYVRVTEVWGE